jgi:hypothetical protein
MRFGVEANRGKRREFYPPPTRGHVLRIAVVFASGLAVMIGIVYLGYYAVSRL